MKLKDFTKTYNLHDSYFISADYDEPSHKLSMEVMFSFWTQKDYVESAAEQGVLKLTFSDVSLYSCLDGNPCSDSAEILGVRMDNEALVFSMLDTDEDCYFELKIQASDVTVAVI